MSPSRPASGHASTSPVVRPLDVDGKHWDDRGRSTARQPGGECGERRSGAAVREGSGRRAIRRRRDPSLLPLLWVACDAVVILLRVRLSRGRARPGKLTPFSQTS